MGCYNPRIMKDDKKDPEGDKQKPRTGSDDDPESDASEAGLKPVRPKIGESENNLQQRADWFQKRSGRR